jgi:hypothetical protein
MLFCLRFLFLYFVAVENSISVNVFSHSRPSKTYRDIVMNKAMPFGAKGATLDDARDRRTNSCACAIRLLVLICFSSVSCFCFFFLLFFSLLVCSQVYDVLSWRTLSRSISVSWFLCLHLVTVHSGTLQCALSWQTRMILPSVVLPLVRLWMS